jgi:CRISPR/Cas system-associated protein Cas5 (RAMP superfamily)
VDRKLYVSYVAVERARERQKENANKLKRDYAFTFSCILSFHGFFSSSTDKRESETSHEENSQRRKRILMKF